MQPDDGRVVSNFIVQALRGDPITIYGDGGQTRSFCYVDDLVSGLVALMESPPELTGPVNLGNPSEFTVRQLAELLIDLTGSPSQLVFCPLPADDPRQRQPDISLAATALSWRPGTSLRDGLMHTITYFEALLTAGPAHAIQRLKPLPAAGLHSSGAVSQPASVGFQSRSA
jgi:UDP-glucuronate decarboxylase